MEESCFLTFYAKMKKLNIKKKQKRRNDVNFVPFSQDENLFRLNSAEAADIAI